MPICPNCEHDFKQRKAGGCPNCGEPLQIWKGFAFRESVGSPPQALLERFEKLVSERTSQQQKKPIVWRIPRKSARYRRELVEAERLLMVECEGNYDLAVAVLNTLFTNKQFYRNYTSLVGIYNVFTLAKAVTEAQLSQQEEADNLQSSLFDRVMQRENIFS